MQSVLQDKPLLAQISKICQIKSVSGKELCTFHIGGNVQILLEINSIESLLQLLKLFNTASAPYRIIGKGSNVLIPDEGIEIPIIKLSNEFASITQLSSKEFEVGAACNLMNLAEVISKNNLSGLEFAGGIPASLGGAAAMNAGAYGSQMADIVTYVRMVSHTGEQYTLKASEINFSYRTSNLPLTDFASDVVVSVGIKCSDEKSSGAAEQVRKNYLSERRAKQPLEYPSAGSIFKNPENNSAGLLIEKSGLKGKTFGGAKISEKHANWIVNHTRTAKASDVKYLCKLAQEKVQEETGIQLETELKFW